MWILYVYCATKATWSVYVAVLSCAPASSSVFVSLLRFFGCCGGKSGNVRLWRLRCAARMSHLICIQHVCSEDGSINIMDLVSSECGVSVVWWVSTTNTTWRRNVCLFMRSGCDTLVTRGLRFEMCSDAALSQLVIAEFVALLGYWKFPSTLIFLYTQLFSNFMPKFDLIWRYLYTNNAIDIWSEFYYTSMPGVVVHKSQWCKLMTEQ